MSTRKTVGAVLAIAAAGLVAVWLYAIAKSTEQLRPLSLPAAAGDGSVSASPPPPVATRSSPPTVDTPPDRTLIVQESAGAPTATEGVETLDLSSPPSAGPISGASFAELLDSGLVGEENDSVAAEELRRALHDAAADFAEPE